MVLSGEITVDLRFFIVVGGIFFLCVGVGFWLAPPPAPDTTRSDWEVACQDGKSVIFACDYAFTVAPFWSEQSEIRLKNWCECGYWEENRYEYITDCPCGPANEVKAIGVFE